MAIEDLFAFIQPPRHPREAEGDWEAVETELSIRYPTDIRATNYF